MKTEVNFTFKKVQHDKENELHLVVSLKAPKKDWEKERPPICVIPVVDVSGSMSGQKLDYAKKSGLKLAEHLQTQDYAGLGSFGDEAHVDYEVQPMNKSNKDQLNSKIGDLHMRGCTNFSGGMLMGLEQLNKADIPKNTLKRVIMLTDGMANRGITRRADLMKMLEKNLGDATFSCFGYGRDADQELLADMAKLGKGNYAFIQNPDDALSAFAKELGGLLSTYAQNIKIEVVSKGGHEVIEVISDIDADGDEKKVTASFPEILSEEDRHIVVKVKLAKQSKALPREMCCFDVNVSYDVIKEDGSVVRETEIVTARINFVKPGKEQDKPNKELDAIVAIAEMVKGQTKAEEMAKGGDYRGAQDLLEGMTGAFSFRGHDGQAAMLQKLGSKMSDSRSYSANLEYFSGTKSRMRRSFGTAKCSDEVMADTRSYISEGTNNAQKSMTANFEDDLKAAFVEDANKVVVAPAKPAVSPVSKISKKRSDRW